MHISDWGSDVCSSDLLPFRALSGALDGFGVFATGNYTYSSIKFANNPIEAITLPGLSKWTGSGTVYFEKWGFEARANYRYRSSFLAEVAGLSANPTYRTARADGILDARSEEHTSELQSLMRISYAVFCLQ